jgi:hypothetical protein
MPLDAIHVLFDSLPDNAHQQWIHQPGEQLVGPGIQGYDQPGAFTGVHHLERAVPNRSVRIRNDTNPLVRGAKELRSVLSRGERSKHGERSEVLSGLAERFGA